MKQHITPEQLNELSEKGEKRLRKWWEDGHCRMDWEGDEDARFVLMLDIGQMIEFLDNKYPNQISLFPTTWNRKENKWQEKWWWNLTLTRGEMVNPVYQSDELCDALFEAVKEILDKS